MRIDKEEKVIDSYLLSFIVNKNGKFKNDSISLALGVIIQAEHDGLYGHAGSIRVRFKDDAMKWYRKNKYRIPKHLINFKELHSKELMSRALVLAIKNITEFHVRSDLYKGLDNKR